jgi:predicted RNA binding protein YcfA (HicA-like mRNA interferase family)
VKTPRNVDGPQLVKALKKLGYERVRQEGSHIRLSTQQNSEHHVTVPNHAPIRVGTFSCISKTLPPITS